MDTGVCKVLVVWKLRRTKVVRQLDMYDDENEDEDDDDDDDDKCGEPQENGSEIHIGRVLSGQPSITLTGSNSKAYMYINDHVKASQ